MKTFLFIKLLTLTLLPFIFCQNLDESEKSKYAGIIGVNFNETEMNKIFDERKKLVAALGYDKMITACEKVVNATIVEDCYSNGYIRNNDIGGGCCLVSPSDDAKKKDSTLQNRCYALGSSAEDISKYNNNKLFWSKISCRPAEIDKLESYVKGYLELFPKFTWDMGLQITKEYNDFLNKTTGNVTICQSGTIDQCANYKVDDNYRCCLIDRNIVNPISGAENDIKMCSPMGPISRNMIKNEKGVKCNNGKWLSVTMIIIILTILI